MGFNEGLVFAVYIADFSNVSKLCTSLITARKQSLGQSNVFTPVCHSVGGWCWLPSMYYRSPDKGEVCMRGSASSGGLHLGGVQPTRPQHYGIRSAYRRYASYWNAFLYYLFNFGKTSTIISFESLNLFKRMSIIVLIPFKFLWNGSFSGT